MGFDDLTMRLIYKIKCNSMNDATRSRVKYQDTLLASLEFGSKIVCLRTSYVKTRITNFLFTNLLGCGVERRRVMKGKITIRE